MDVQGEKRRRSKFIIKLMGKVLNPEYRKPRAKENNIFKRQITLKCYIIFGDVSDLVGYSFGSR
jgi:hypothetical protein